MKGIFTVIEGIDGSGKGTQSVLLNKYIQSRGYTTLFRHYPTYGETAVGGVILEMLQNKAHLITSSGDLHPARSLVLQSLFAVDRYQLDPENRLAVKLGHHLVFDRYYHSSVVYGKCTGVDPSWLYSVNSQLLQPDLAILLDVSPDVSVMRRPGRRDQFEVDLELLENVAFNYRIEWDSHYNVQKNYHVINGKQDIEQIHAEITRLWEQVYSSNQKTTY